MGVRHPHLSYAKIAVCGKLSLYHTIPTTNLTLRYSCTLAAKHRWIHTAETCFAKTCLLHTDVDFTKLCMKVSVYAVQITLENHMTWSSQWERRAKQIIVFRKQPDKQCETKYICLVLFTKYLHMWPNSRAWLNIATCYDIPDNKEFIGLKCFYNGGAGKHEISWGRGGPNVSLIKISCKPTPGANFLNIRTMFFTIFILRIF